MSLCKSDNAVEDFMVLTPNRRLALAKREAYDQQQIFAKKTAWISLSVLPLQEWVVSLSQIFIQQEWIPAHLLLNTHQTDLIWQNILNETTEKTFAPFFHAAVKAWLLSHQWEIDIHHADFLKYEDSEIWQQWALQFCSHLRKNKWMDQCLALHQLIASLEKLDKKTIMAFLPSHITLLAFTHFTPVEKKFLGLLQKHGVNITQENLINNENPSICTKIGFDDEDTEFEALARWAYEKSHTGSVACVIPHLASVKNKMMAIFERYIEDKAVLNFSLGNMLSDYPLIQAALTGIKLLEDKTSIETISQFLLSPFYQNSLNTLSQRAILDAKLKAQIPPLIDKITLLQILDNHPASYGIRKFFEKTISIEIYKNFYDWAEFFQDHLQFLGWPGERTLSSEEFQLLAHWNSLIEDFGSLSIVSGKINFQSARSKLVEMAHHSLFQPKRSPTANIHILGTLEAAGLFFDHVWLAGFQENVWPAKMNANPFLPFSLQRKINMPHANPAENLKFYENITQQLFSAAPEVIVSYPKTYQNNPSRPSLLIQKIPEQEISFPQLLKIAEKQQKSYKDFLENIEDHQAPRVEIENNFSYGSEIFKDQTACPFRAYAKHRLKAKKIELPELGFKAFTRGNLVHQVLEKFFKQVPAQEKLNTLSSADLSHLIYQIIDDILTKIPKDIFTIVEKKRLGKLMLSWMEYEKKREPFTVIATEEVLKTHFGNLSLNLRIDRIDKIGADEYMIIDYKTGKINFNSDSHSLDEPQLPLYCVVSGLSVKNIAFAQLRTDEIKFKSFSAQKEQWEKALLILAEEYLSGHAAVKPKYGKETCRFCDLISLCRIKEI